MPMPKWTFPPLIVVSSIVALSMRPNKSFPFETLAPFTISFRDYIISFKYFEIAIWTKNILMFNGVGRKPQTHKTTKLRMQLHKKIRIYFAFK
jgi:hypothetical protein